MLIISLILLCVPNLLWKLSTCWMRVDSRTSWRMQHMTHRCPSIRSLWSQLQSVRDGKCDRPVLERCCFVASRRYLRRRMSPHRQQRCPDPWTSCRHSFQHLQKRRVCPASSSAASAGDVHSASAWFYQRSQFALLEWTAWASLHTSLKRVSVP